MRFAFTPDDELSIPLRLVTLNRVLLATVLGGVQSYLKNKARKRTAERKLARIVQKTRWSRRLVGVRERKL